MNAAARNISEVTPIRVPVPGTDYMVVSKVYGIAGARYTVLFDGEYYVVNEHLLAALKRGETPAELELDPEEIDEDLL